MADSVKIRITGEDSEFRNTLSGIGKSAGSVFKGIMASQIVTKGLSLLTNGLRSAINTGMEFEAAMSQVAAISGATDAELQQLSDTAKHYGETTKFSASQAAEALNYMALAGWDAQQSMDALGGVLDLAAASGMELGAASDAVTDYLSAFGMEASKAGYMADMMAYAQSKSNTTAAMLADAYGNCASSMHSAGQDIETTTALLMSLANQGIKGSEAGTQLSAVMRDLTQKMENGNIKIGKTAVAVKDAQGNFRDLNDILTDVGRATEGMGTAEKSSALMETFTARSIKAINTLLNDGMANVNAYEDALRGSAGTAAEQAETMMDNLKGDVQIFQSALEGLQITASESTNGIARSMVQEATGILDAMNRAGKTGGIGGMADALLAQIPSLLPKLTKGVENLLGGLGKRLPGLVKNLIATVPDVLGGMGNLVPGLVESLTSALGAGIDGLVSNLPSIMPSLVSGFWKTFVSLSKGAGSLLDSLFSGIDTAAMKLGLRDLTLDEVLQQKLDEVDAERVKKISGTIDAEYTFGDVTIDTEAYTAALKAAIETIESVIDGIVEISDEDKEAIKNAILSGSGYDALVAAFNAMDVPDAEARATEIATAINTITGAVSNLNLPADAVESIYTAVSEGATQEKIATIIESYGIDTDTANATAATIMAADQTIEGAIGDLGVSPSVIVGALLSGGANKALIVAALNTLGLSPEDYQSVLDSYDTADGTLSAKIKAAFDSLKSSLTNGIPDANDPEFAEAKQKVADFFDAAYGVIDEWEANKIKELEESGLTGTDLQTRIDTITSEAEQMRTDLAALQAQTTEWVDANAGAAKEVVKGHFDELDAMIEQVLGLDAKIAALKGAMTSAGATNRRAVEQGLITDQKGQLEAMNYSSQELDYALKTANDKASLALEEAGEKFAGDAEGYAKRRAEILDQLATEEGEAYGNYDDHMQKIVASMLQNSPEMMQAIEQYGQQQDLADSAQRLFQGLSDAMSKAAAAAARGEEFDPFAFLTENAGITEADYTSIAEGLNIDPAALQQAISQSLKTGEMGSLFTSEDFQALLNPEQGFADILAGMDLSGAGSVFETLSTALNTGLLRAGNDVDWTNVNAIIQTGIDGIGSGVTDGLASSMSDTSSVVSAGNTLGTAAVDSVADGAQTHSPSAATMAVGQGVVQGLAAGMADTGSVTAAAGALGRAAITAVSGEATQMQSAGRNFSSGLASGIRSGQSTVISAAIAVAKAAAQAVRDALGIASPSRVMMEVGQFTGEGFAIGLQDSLSTAIRAAQTVVGAANLSPKMDFSGLSTSMNGAINDLADLENSREWAFYLNGREMARASTRDYNTALNGYGKRISLGYGRG